MRASDPMRDGGAAVHAPDGGTTAVAGECTEIKVDPGLTGNACNTARDKCYFAEHDAVVREISSKCATGGLLTADGRSCVAYAATPEAPEAIACYLACAKNALQARVGEVPSDECLRCANKVFTCDAKFCLAQCISNAQSPRCMECACTSHPDVIAPGRAGSCSIDVFEQCAGIRLNPAAVGCQ